MFVIAGFNLEHLRRWHILLQHDNNNNCKHNEITCMDGNVKFYN